MNKDNIKCFSSFNDFVINEKKKKKKINPAYLTKDKKAMRREIKRHAHKSDDDQSAYQNWEADYEGGDTTNPKKRYKTKTSKYTQEFQKKYGKK